MKDKVKKTLDSINGLLSKEQTEIIKIASLLILPNLAAKITGQVLDLIIASLFGTSKPFSLFLVADALPQMVANIFLFGVVGAVVIPIFVEVKQKETKEKFLDFYSTVFNVTVLIFCLVSAIIIIFADRFMPFVLNYLIDPKKVPTPEDITLVVDMMRVLFLPPILLGASVFISSGLNVYNRYLLPQLSPLFYNVGMLISTIIFIPLFNKSPWAIVAGVILGSILHLAIQLPLAHSLGLRIKPILDWRSPYLRKLGKVAIPRLIAFSTEQFTDTVTKFIAFSINYAFTAAQFYAGTVINAIPSLFGSAFAIASYPTLAALYNEKNYKEFINVVMKTINEVVFLSLPFIISLIVLRLPAVRLIYGLFPGKFDRESTYMTAWLVLFLGLGVLFESLRSFSYRIFYAAKNTKIPLLIAVITMIFSLGCAVVFSNYFSHFNTYALQDLRWDPSFFFSKSTGKAAIAGIGLSVSLGVAIEVVMLMIFFHKYILKYDWKKLLRDLARKLVPGLVMAVLMFVMYKMWNGLDALPVDANPNFQGSTTFNLIILTFITSFTSFMVYYLLCMLLGVEELKILRKVLNPLFRLGGLEIK